MKNKQIILSCSANVFGYQLQKGFELSVIDTMSLNFFLPSDENDSKKIIKVSLELFDKTSQDFINEVKRVNDLFDEVEKQGGKLPLYEFEITNKNKEKGESCVLFGMNYYLLTPNFGSDINVSVVPFHPNISYLEYLQKSASSPLRIDLIRIECQNSNQITQIINYQTKDANGKSVKVPIVTQSYFLPTQEDASKLDVFYPCTIDGNTYLQFTVLPNTTLKIKIYGETAFNLDSDSVDILNGLLSCQIQQGLDFVSVDNIKKFLGDKYNYYFQTDTVEKQLHKMSEKNIINSDGGLFGSKFRILKVDGTLAQDLTLTQVLQNSEYNLLKK